MKNLKPLPLLSITFFLVFIVLCSCTQRMTKPYIEVILNTEDTISLPSNFSKIDSNYIFSHVNEEYELFINKFISRNFDKSIYHKSNILVNANSDDHII